MNINNENTKFQEDIDNFKISSIIGLFWMLTKASRMK
jgi:hypothetical protein